MGLVRVVDSGGDWSFGKGKNDYKSGVNAVEQNIKTRLQSFLGNCFFAINDGIDWFNLLGSKNQLALELAVRATILNTAEVTGLVSSAVILDPITRRITMTYVVTTAYTLNGVETQISSNSTLLLTEDGDIITTEDGQALGAG